MGGLSGLSISAARQLKRSAEDGVFAECLTLASRSDVRVGFPGLVKSDKFTGFLLALPNQRHAMDVINRIESQLAENPVILYMKGTPAFPQCGFSGRAVQILQHCGTPFAHVNIFEDPELRENLKTYSNWPTFPQLYIKGELVGGCDIMMDLFQSGELQKMLDSANAGNA
jgi:monothiol glutaredoxin